MFLVGSFCCGYRSAIVVERVAARGMAYEYESIAWEKDEGGCDTR